MKYGLSLLISLLLLITLTAQAGIPDPVQWKLKSLKTKTESMN